MSLSSYALKLAEATGHPMADHSRATAELASEVAVELEFEQEARGEVEIAALLHDIGKLALMEEIVYKPDGLSEHELELIKRHPVRGQAMLERAGEPFHRIAGIVRSCYERWDGNGYPDGLAGEEIPMPSRIIFCCTAYVSMTTDRPYSKAVSHARTLSELWAGSGSQFDPEVVSALVRAASRRPVPAAAERSVGSERDAARSRVGSAVGDTR